MDEDDDGVCAINGIRVVYFCRFEVKVRHIEDDELRMWCLGGSDRMFSIFVLRT
jgi:hypothetical protein